MSLDNSQRVNLSSVHDMLIVTDCELRPDTVMSRSLKDIANRLEITRKALGISAAQIARETSISANEWSQYIHPEKYKRKISTDQVLELKDIYGFTLEWVFDGDLLSLREPLRAKVRVKLRLVA